MAHKTLIGGTAYDLTGGGCLIGGTGYNITGGRTLVGGTGYDISFIKATFDELMADAVLYRSTGLNRSSSREINFTLNDADFGTWYLFALTWAGSYSSPSNSRFSIFKVERPTMDELTVTQLNHAVSSSINSPQIYVSKYTSSGKTYFHLYMSIYGTESNLYTAATMQLLKFPSYPLSVCDKVLSSITIDGVSGRSATTQQSVNSAYTGTERWIVAYERYMSYSSPLGNVIYSNFQTNPSLLYFNIGNGTAYVSTSGTSATSVYGASIYSITE